MRTHVVSCAMALMLAGGWSRAGEPGGPLSTAEIVEQTEPSIALVKGKASLGTGFLAGPGLLVTNAHVIDDEFIAGLEVAFPSADEAKRGPYPAELLYEDRKRDLAVLAVKVDLPPLRVAPSYAFRKGEDITIIGNPGLGGDVVLENAVSKGVLSTKAEIDGQKFYQLGASINPGNSGGPVFDSKGQVIGVATLKSAKEEALAFCVPVEDLRAALDKVAEQKPSDAEAARSRHRIVAAVQGLGGGGAIYSLGIDLRRFAAITQGAANAQIQEVGKKIDAVIGELDKEAFPAFTPEIAAIKKDTTLTPALKDKVVRLSDNFARLRTTYRSKPAELTRAAANLKSMKDRHRQLITELSRDLKLDVPEQMMVAFDDHPTPTPTVIAQIAPVRPGSGGGVGIGGNAGRASAPGSSLRQRMEERKNSQSRIGSRNSSSGSSLRDRMKARRGNH